MSSEHSEKTALRILVADDHFVVRQGLRLILEGEANFVLVGEAVDGAAGLAALRAVLADSKKLKPEELVKVFVESGGDIK